MFSDRWLVTLGIAFAFCLMASPRCDASPAEAGLRVQTLSKIDIDLLDEISRSSFRYFWEQTSPRTGLVFDRAISRGPKEVPGDQPRVASIAATGFGLTAVCIAKDQRWIGPEAARERALTTLRFLAYGFYLCLMHAHPNILSVVHLGAPFRRS